MKKVATLLLILSFLSSVAGCDFLRRVAGRPTSADIERIGNAISEFRQDSIRKCRQRIADSLLMADSIARQGISEDFGVKFSGVFTFGEPSSERMKKYNLIVGVYRYLSSFAPKVAELSGRGFNPFEINFPGGEYALCLGSCDNAEGLRELISRGRGCGVCPKDAWIYVNERK